jgi:hypothetical protein
MGLRDLITGKRKLAGPAEDRLFALTTATITLETSLGLHAAGAGAIVFQPLQTADFAQVAADMQELVTAAAADTGTTVATSDDSYGFRWLVVRGAEIDDLVVSIHAISDALTAGGYGERLLCAVFAFRDERDRPLYFIYNHKRGSFYPFAPASEGERDNERELVVSAQIGGEMPVEDDLQRWFPLWGIPI